MTIASGGTCNITFNGSDKATIVVTPASGSAVTVACHVGDLSRIVERVVQDDTRGAQITTSITASSNRSSELWQGSKVIKG